MGMLEGSQSTGLLDELAGGFLLNITLAAVGGDPLDRDLTFHPGIIPPINRSQASLADFSPYFVSVFHDVEVPQSVE